MKSGKSTNTIGLLAFLIGVPLFAQVKVYEETISMPSWEVGPPQVHSLFPDAGGRSSEIYPYSLHETLIDNKANKDYRGVVLENEYVKILILPEIGGRLHGALDKTNGYEWLYWHKTIKPALVSMTGEWISGGIEWNFPIAHRPSGFMPVEHRIVRHSDGSATVWVGETEPILRMRWLVGMTLFPGRSYLRCDYVFINPTDYKNPFQVWATSGTYANEWAQAQYPGDMVTGHGKHEFWNWPIHDGVDLTWWKNVPNASSFFAFNNPSDWFGTYDHKANAGMVHVADHHIMPGKKLWTWGSGPSGRIWETILSDGNSAYFEPQSGVFSDNQPDFHWMSPHEVKTAEDYWYPVRDSRGYHNANKDFAINTDLKNGKAFGAVNSTAAVSNYKVVLKDTRRNTVLSQAVTAISPDKPYVVEVPAGTDATVYDLYLAVYDSKGKLCIELQQHKPQTVPLPPGQNDPGDPKAMTQDELIHSGEWLAEFRRPAEALAYFHEALRKDPKDSRANVEMGFLSLKQGEWNEALGYLNSAQERDGDNSRIFFGKALAYAGLLNFNDAYDQFYRASYAYDYHSAAYLNLARIDLRRGDFEGALKTATEAEQQNARFADIHALKAVALRHMNRHAEALAAAEAAVRLDPMHPMGLFETSAALKNSGKPNASAQTLWLDIMRGEVQNYLDLAVNYANAGRYLEADSVLAAYSTGKTDVETHPMVNYLRGYFKDLSGEKTGAAEFYAKARRGPAPYTNPHRLEEKDALEAAIRQHPSDAHACLFLGNLLYALGRREEGLNAWKKAVELESSLELAWRNVAYGERFLHKDLAAARAAYQNALRLDPRDARVLLESDQVAEELGTSSSERMAVLMSHLETVKTRDDLIATLIDLRLAQGDTANLKLAYETLKDHHFHSWEGQYGIHFSWIDANRKLGDLALAARDFRAARAYYEQECQYPGNLEVAPRTPDFRAYMNWDLARLYVAAGETQQADLRWKEILAEKYSSVHIGTYYQALAKKAQGDEQGYHDLLAELEMSAHKAAAGEFGHRGDREAVGHYLLSVVLGEKGDRAGAATEIAKALKQNPRVARSAIQQAQLDIANAHW